MAKTEFSTSHALRVEKWSAVMFRYARYSTFFARFIGKNVKPAKGIAISTDPNAVIQLKSDFKKGKGDKVTFGMRSPLTGTGVTGDNQLEGNEERLSFLDYAIELFKTRNAVRSEGELSDKRVVFDAKMQAKDALGEWLAHQIDDYTLAVLSGLASADGNVAAATPSTNRIWVGGQTTADVLTHISGNTHASLSAAATYLFGPRVIEAVKRKAQLSTPKVRPVIVNGKAYYVMLIHQYQAKALKASADWKAAQRDANIRGEKNPIFSGALGVYDGVIIHEWEKIETRLGEGGATVSEYFNDSGDPLPNGIEAARALFLGAQAGVHAYGKLPYYKADSFDYGDEWGVAVGVMMAVGRPEFDSEDYGTIAVDTCIESD